MHLLGGPASQNVHYLRQTIDLLFVIDGTTYGATTPLLPGGSVGAHVRHCLDYYDCFLRGLRRGEVDYSRRRRNREWEARLDEAMTAARGVLRSLERLDAEALDLPLRVRSEDAGPADPDSGWCGSTVARELQFLLSHTIHHQALIGVVLRSAGFEPARSFGVAPSTLAFWSERGGPAARRLRAESRI